jgi:hypothetical protein
MQDEPEQKPNFKIEGPDENGCVWLNDPGGVWRINMGAKDAVAEAMCEWLSIIDYGECH